MAEDKAPDKASRKTGSDRFKNFVSAFMQGNGQNDALQYLKDTAAPVSIFLITGVKFDGVISSFDQYTISILDVKNHQQMIYKDKISTLTLKRADFKSGRGKGGARAGHQHGGGPRVTVIRKSAAGAK